MELCMDCGKPINPGEPSYYRKNPADDIGETFHSRCGPEGAKAKDAEIERLRGILTQVANDGRTWQLHERSKELLRPFVVEHLDGVPNVSIEDGLKSRTGQAQSTAR